MSNELTPRELAEMKAHARDALARKLLWDREPAVPPFPKGATLRYIGEPQSDLPLHAAARVVGVYYGRRGDLTHLVNQYGEKLYWNDDKDAPVLDRTIDGFTTIVVQGRRVMLKADAAQDWELIAEAPALGSETSEELADRLGRERRAAREGIRR